jgi:hypothetical protein
MSVERLAEYDEHEHRYCIPTYKRRKHNVAKRLFFIEAALSVDDTHCMSAEEVKTMRDEYKGIVAVMQENAALKSHLEESDCLLADHAEALNEYKKALASQQNEITVLAESNATLKSERDVAVRALEMACENECSGIGFDMMGCPPHGEDCKQCDDKVKCWTDYYIQQAKGDLQK